MLHSAPERTEQHVASTLPFVVGQAILLIAIVVGYVWCRPVLDLDEAELLYPASVIFVILSCWCLWSWKRVNGAVFEPYGLFLIAVILFNGGQAILEVIHLNPKGILNGEFPPETTLATLYLVALGLAALHFGALLSVRRPSIAIPPVAGWPTPEVSLNSVRFVGWTLLLLSLVPAILVLKQAITVVASAGYFALYQQNQGTGLDAGSRVLASFLVPSSLFLLAGSKNVRRGLLVSAGVVISYATIELFLGGRYQALMPLIVYIWLWHRCIHPIPRGLLVGASVFTLVVIFPLVSTTRDISGADRLSPAVLTSAFMSINNPLAAAVSEMGATMRVSAYSLTLVPSFRPYDAGATYGYAALAFIPNFFWSIHPTIAHGTISHWLVQFVDSGFASAGGGLGFSLIAEAYANFGWVGAPIVLGLIGFGYAKFVRWGTAIGSPAKLATIASFATFFTFYARTESTEVLRPLIWYALLPYAFVLLVTHINARYAMRGAASGREFAHPSLMRK